MIKNSIKRITRKLFPKGSSVDRKLKTIGVHMRLVEPPIDYRYHAWTVENEPGIFSELTQKQDIKFSIVTPAFNTPKKYLEPLLYSVINQTYDNWEWIVVDGSSDEDSSERIKQLESVDLRVRVIKTKNKGIAANTNVGLAVVSGDYVVLLDHDDALAAEALNELAAASQKNKSPDFIYSDEDKLVENGSRRHMPHLKADLSIDLLRNLNYITHIVCIKTDFLSKIGHLNPEYDGAQDYDLMLRVVDASKNIVYVPKVLYHWREAEASTAANFSVKPQVLEAGVKALEAHLKRNKLGAQAKPMRGKPGFYRVKYNYSNAKIQEVDGLPAKTKIGDSDFVLISGQEILRTDGWQSELCGILQQNPDVGVVCPIIINQYGQVVDAGQINKVKTKMFYGADYATNTYFGDTDWVRNLDTAGPVMLARTSLLEEYFAKNKKFTTKGFSDYVNARGLRIVLWSFDPWIKEGDIIRNEDKALISDMAAFEGYGYVKK